MRDLIPGDKAQHFVAGVAISLAGFAAAVVAGWSASSAGIAALVVAALAGIAKEVLDRADNLVAQEAGKGPMHDVEFGDFAWTGAGGLPVFIGAVVAGVLS